LQPAPLEDWLDAVARGDLPWIIAARNLPPALDLAELHARRA
jgi:hypothetical protein